MDWRLTIGGAVTTTVTWTWDFLAQPQFKDVSDSNHCVTSWSQYDNEWEGVSFKQLMTVVQPLASARFVLFKSFDDYTTNLPLSACQDDDVLLTYKWNGRPLTKEHGGPVPHDRPGSDMPGRVPNGSRRSRFQSMTRKASGKYGAIPIRPSPGRTTGTADLRL